MSDESTPSLRRTIERLLVALSAEVGVSLVTGTPPNPASLLTIVGEDIITRRRGRAEEFVESVVDQVGQNELLAAIQSDPERDALLWNALQAVMATELDNKRIYLARVVANAMTNDDKIDDAQFIAAALQELDGPHIAGLTRLRAADDANQADPGINDEILNSALMKEPIPVLAALVRAGVVYQGSVERGDGLFSIPNPRTYGITGVNEFGRKILDDLQSIDVAGE